MRNEKNILQHELIGLRVRVVGSRCENYEDLTGCVIDETKNMIVIDTGMKIVKISKSGNTFEFELPEKSVIVEGNIIRIRSEDRTKRLGLPKIRREFQKMQKRKA